MKSKALLAVGGLALASALLPAVASAHTDLSIGVNLGGGYPVYEAPAPVYYYPTPAPVYYGGYGGSVGYYDGGRRWCPDDWRAREHREHEWREHEWHERHGRRWHDDD